MLGVEIRSDTIRVTSGAASQTCRQLPVAESNRATAAGGESRQPCGPAKPRKYFCTTQSMDFCMSWLKEK